jgi:hypothetical protein
MNVVSHTPTHGLQNCGHKKIQDGLQYSVVLDLKLLLFTTVVHGFLLVEGSPAGFFNKQ